jgi:endoglucanase
MLCLLFALLAACADSESSGSVNDRLRNVTSAQLVRLMGNGINLGNTMEACNIHERAPNRDPSVYEIMWGNPITTQEMITGMRDAGFMTLRVPVAWTNAMDWESGDFTINPAYLARVEEIINYALNEDMYVIMNNHWDHGWWSMFGHPDQAWRDFAEEMFIAMWTQVATHFQDYDLRLIFEPANEEWGNRFNDRTTWSPTGGTLTQDECYILMTHLGQVFVDLIRTGAGSGGRNADRFILMKGYNTDVEMTTDARFNMPRDPRNRLLLGVHYYTPWSYCGDTSGVGHWGRLSEVEEMNHLLGSLTKFTDMGYGIVMGEWGVLDNVGPDRLSFFTNFLDNAELHGFATMLWDTGWTEQHGGLFDRNYSKTIVAPEILELFRTRTHAIKNDSTAEIISRAQASIENNLEIARNRPETVIEADEAFAWIMFSSGDWSVQYSVGDRYQPESIAAGLVATDVEITGEGVYTVALDFTGTSQGHGDGISFSAVGIINGEILFPGYIMNVTSILINGNEANLVGEPFTTNDNPVTMRVNLYNEWVTNIPPEARVLSGDLSNVSPTILENYRLTLIETLQVTFELIAP